MIWELAGEVGLDPGPFTLRQLIHMARGSWSKAATLLSLLRNIHRDPKSGHTFTPDECNPFTIRTPIKPIVLPVSALCDVFMRNAR